MVNWSQHTWSLEANADNPKTGNAKQAAEDAARAWEKPSFCRSTEAEESIVAAPKWLASLIPIPPYDLQV